MKLAFFSIITLIQMNNIRSFHSHKIKYNVPAILRFGFQSYQYIFSITQKLLPHEISIRNRYYHATSSTEASVGTIAVDVNALPDCKRRLNEVTQKIESNLRKEVVDYTSISNSLKDMEMVN